MLREAQSLTCGGTKEDKIGKGGKKLQLEKVRTVLPPGPRTRCRAGQKSVQRGAFFTNACAISNGAGRWRCQGETVPKNFPTCRPRSEGGD